jgi:outer membrane protein assembly factor BamE (lipoprotein component of BamABCDE complex)
MLKNCAFIFVSLFAFTLFVAGCAHPYTIQKVRTGMSKAEVLEIAGNPNHTGRKSNADVWLYVDTATTSGKKTEVYFQEGKVSYIGEPRAEKSGEDKAGNAFRPIGGDQ